jgi:hypothetical protein
MPAQNHIRPAAMSVAALFRQPCSSKTLYPPRKIFLSPGGEQIVEIANAQLRVKSAQPRHSFLGFCDTPNDRTTRRCRA